MEESEEQDGLVLMVIQLGTVHLEGMEAMAEVMEMEAEMEMEGEEDRDLLEELEV